ncbi:hypothetical protein [Kitasatospora sp. GP82]|nr:hypothetical protein [Kitasatospora sp. GP82]MDH6128274.1 hypothetical protein [Kitasatospora sp. GP82]
MSARTGPVPSGTHGEQAVRTGGREHPTGAEESALVSTRWR